MWSVDRQMHRQTHAWTGVRTKKTVPCFTAWLATCVTLSQQLTLQNNSHTCVFSIRDQLNSMLIHDLSYILCSVVTFLNNCKKVWLHINHFWSQNSHTEGQMDLQTDAHTCDTWWMSQSLVVKEKNCTDSGNVSCLSGLVSVCMSRRWKTERIVLFWWPRVYVRFWS